MTDLDKVREYFGHDIYATKTTGIELIEVSDGYAKCRLPVTEALMNAAGSVMGGAIYTLADFSYQLFRAGEGRSAFLRVPGREGRKAELLRGNDDHGQPGARRRTRDDLRNAS